ncbi:hypothetical protein WN943_010913 [Citrus x changshan-huyou]
MSTCSVYIAPDNGNSAFENRNIFVLWRRLRGSLLIPNDQNGQTVQNGSAKDWVMPDENSEKYLQGESADGQWDKLPGKHFTIKRIQEWVKRDCEGLNGPTAIKVDGKCICQPQGLNQSGNAILRITAGALPRGLHILNLLKNNISAIEGLRENLPAMFYVDSFIL